jgi:hypothetical protein
MVRRRSAGSLATILAGATNGSLRAIATINLAASARRCARGDLDPASRYRLVVGRPKMEPRFLRIGLADDD